MPINERDFGLKIAFSEEISICNRFPLKINGYKKIRVFTANADNKRIHYKLNAVEIQLERCRVKK